VAYDKQDVLDVIENLVYTASGNIYRAGAYCIYKHKSTQGLVIEMPNETKESIKDILLEDIDLSDEELKNYASWYSDCIKEIRHIYNTHKSISPSSYFV
jgi:hypothetical protein